MEARGKGKPMMKMTGKDRIGHRRAIERMGTEEWKAERERVGK